MFNELGLSEPLLKAIAETGYETPTPIQLQAIPPVLTGKDVLGIAQTGTGKTAAFALPILHRLAADRKPTPRNGTRALILSPTRELATQIAESFRTYGRHLGFSVTVVFGGVSERPQAERLSRGVDILVATPGRLLDHMAQRNVVLGTTEIFVLDEADQMLDLGFFKPIRRIVATLPKQRQSLFFSATMPKEIEELTRELLNDPVKVAVTPESTTVERVSQRVILIEQAKKKALLAELLSEDGMHRALVFTRTKRGADRVAKHLVGAKVEAAAIHGNKSQNQREAALANFREGKVRVLVATDIAARGIDIDEVTHVVNFELPDVPEAYVHRIGRTARAGASGAAISFCDGGERQLLRDIERLTRQTIESVDRRNDPSLVADRPANDHSHTPRGGAQQRGGGGRSSERRDDRGDRGDRKPRGDRPDRGERRAEPTVPRTMSGDSEFRPREPRQGGEKRFGGDRDRAPPRGGDRDRAPRVDRAPREDRPDGERRFEARPPREREGGGFKPKEDRGGDRRDGGKPAFGRDGAKPAFGAPRGDRPDRAPQREGRSPDGERPRFDRGDRSPGPDRGDRPPRREHDGPPRDKPWENRGGRPSTDRGADRAPRPEGGEKRPFREARGEGRDARPSGDRPSGDRPREFKPRGDRPLDRNRPASDRLASDRPASNRPASNRTAGGERSERPRPEGERREFRGGGERRDDNRGGSRGREDRNGGGERRGADRPGNKDVRPGGERREGRPGGGDRAATGDRARPRPRTGSGPRRESSASPDRSNNS